MRKTSVKQIVDNSHGVSIDDLDTDAQTLFSFLVLIVDIKHRAKYGKVFEDQRVRGYSKNVQTNEVLADQVSPVDNGLLGY